MGIPNKCWLIHMEAATRSRCPPPNLTSAVAYANYARYADNIYDGDSDANSIRWAEIAINNYESARTALCSLCRGDCGYASIRSAAGVVASIAAARATEVRAEIATEYVCVGGGGGYAYPMCPPQTGVPTCTCDVQAPQNLHCTCSTGSGCGPGKVSLKAGGVKCTCDVYTPNTLHCTGDEYTPNTLQCTCGTGWGGAPVKEMPKYGRAQCTYAVSATPSAAACAVVCQPDACMPAEQGWWSGHRC